MTSFLNGSMKCGTTIIEMFMLKHGCTRMNMTHDYVERDSKEKF